MNRHQIQEDLTRFLEYLEANGLRILAATILIDAGDRDVTITHGNNEMVIEMSLTNLAGINGYRISK